MHNSLVCDIVCIFVLLHLLPCLHVYMLLPRTHTTATRPKSLNKKRLRTWAENGETFVCREHMEGLPPEISPVGFGICMDINPKDFKAESIGRALMGGMLVNRSKLVWRWVTSDFR